FIGSYRKQRHYLSPVMRDCLGNDFLVLWAIENNRSGSLARMCVSGRNCFFLLDHLVRLGEQVHRDCQTDLFCRPEIDDEFKLRCLLYGQISRFDAFQNLVHIVGGCPVQLNEVHPVGHETSFIDKLLLEVNRREAVFAGKLDDPLSFGEITGTGDRYKRPPPASALRFETRSLNLWRQVESRSPPILASMPELLP